MRTTLQIDDDVHLAAKNLAARQRKSVGEVISSLARSALNGESGAAGAAAARSRNGVPLLRGSRSIPVTMDLVNQLRDELP